MLEVVVVRGTEDPPLFKRILKVLGNEGRMATAYLVPQVEIVGAHTWHPGSKVEHICIIRCGALVVSPPTTNRPTRIQSGRIIRRYGL